MKNKIMFVLPDMSWLWDYKSQFSLGILYLSSAIKKYTDFEVELYDTNVNDIKDIPFANVYAFSSVTPTYNNCIELAKSIHEKYPDSQIIIGGVHASMDSGNIDNVFDAVFVGQAEKTIVKYLNYYENMQEFKLPFSVKLINLHKVKIYKQDGDIDIDDLLPDRKLLTDDYIRTPSIFTGGKTFDDQGATSIMFSRGCPYKCTFCTSPKLYPKLNLRNVDCIIDEIKYIIGEYGIRQFRVQDDTFTVNKKFLRELCGKLKPLNIYYRCSTRVNCVDEENIKLLYESGCREIGIGVEVADNDVLKKLDKGITIEMVQNALSIIRKYDMVVRCFFMMGLPYDSYETMNKNIEFIENNKIENVVVGNLLPFKGTRLYDESNKFNIKEINLYGCMNVGKHIPLIPNIKRKDIGVMEHIDIMKVFYDYLIMKEFI